MNRQSSRMMLPLIAETFRRQLNAICDARNPLIIYFTVMRGSINV